MKLTESKLKHLIQEELTIIREGRSGLLARLNDYIFDKAYPEEAFSDNERLQADVYDDNGKLIKRVDRDKTSSPNLKRVTISPRQQQEQSQFKKKAEDLGYKPIEIGLAYVLYKTIKKYGLGKTINTVLAPLWVLSAGAGAESLERAINKNGVDGLLNWAKTDPMGEALLYFIPYVGPSVFAKDIFTGILGSYYNVDANAIWQDVKRIASTGQFYKDPEGTQWRNYPWQKLESNGIYVTDKKKFIEQIKTKADPEKPKSKLPYENYRDVDKLSYKLKLIINKILDEGGLLGRVYNLIIEKVDTINSENENKFNTEYKNWFDSLEGPQPSVYIQLSTDEKDLENIARSFASYLLVKKCGWAFTVDSPISRWGSDILKYLNNSKVVYPMINGDSDVYIATSGKMDMSDKGLEYKYKDWKKQQARKEKKDIRYKKILSIQKSWNRVEKQVKDSFKCA